MGNWTAFLEFILHPDAKRQSCETILPNLIKNIKADLLGQIKGPFSTVAWQMPRYCMLPFSFHPVNDP